jgi:hypothetical protein
MVQEAEQPGEFWKQLLQHCGGRPRHGQALRPGLALPNY